jgi:hypothetical protein
MTERELQQQYQAEKRAWLALNPSATPEQFEAECQRIAEGLGL